MSGRVTIACLLCRYPAVTENWYWCDGKPGVVRLCDFHERYEKRNDIIGGYEIQQSYYYRLLNPSLCTDSDIANVRAAIEAIARICRALWRDDAESREDAAVMRLCAQEVRFTLYEACPLSLVDRGTIHGVTDVKCPACHGAGLVLRDDARERLGRAA